MIESLQIAQNEIKYVLDRMSHNDPRREHLLIANAEIEETKIYLNEV